jgi:PIN domain nuclease of toxin-antitoxin system
MKLLLDTHTLLWWCGGSKRFSRKALRAIQDKGNTVAVSAVSAWEIAIKARSGKLEAGPLLADFQGQLELEGFAELPILIEHAMSAGSMPGPHNDPFDRMLVAQARAEGLSIVSQDRIFDKYSVRRIW